MPDLPGQAYRPGYKPAIPGAATPVNTSRSGVTSQTGGAGAAYGGGGAPSPGQVQAASGDFYQYGGSKDASNKILNDVYWNAVNRATNPKAAPSAALVNPNMASANYAYLGSAQQLGESNAIGKRQQAFADQLQSVADGTAGPSVAELAMQRQSSAAANQNLAAAAGGTGPGANAALINAQNRNAQAQGQLVQDVGIQRAAEQQAARAQLADVLGQTRGQYEAGGQALTNLGQTVGGQQIALGGLGAQQNQYNAQLQAGQNALNQNAEQFYYGNWLNATQGQAGLNAQRASNWNNFYLGQRSNNINEQQVSNAQTDKYVGAGLDALGTIAAGAATVATGGAASPLLGATLAKDAHDLSDIRAKTKIQPAGRQIAELYRGIGSANRQADTLQGAHVVYPGIRGSGDVPAVPAGAARPFAPGEYIDNNDGSWSSERSLTVQDPAFNGGKATVIPSLWIKDGKPYQARDEREAVALAQESGVPFRGYRNLADAERASIARERQWQTVTPETSGRVEPLWSTSDIRAKTRVAPAGPQISNIYRGIASANDQANQIRGTDVQYPGAPSEGIDQANADANAIRTARVEYPSPKSPFESLSPASYYYKNPNEPGAAPGQHFGPMAHELARTPAGRSTLVQMPDGKLGIDTGRLALANASETGQLRREIDALKERKSGKRNSALAERSRIEGGPSFRNWYTAPTPATQAVEPAPVPDRTASFIEARRRELAGGAYQPGAGTSAPYGYF